MQTYRVHCLSGDQIVETGEYIAKDDSEAVTLFHLRGERTDCELWCRERLVAKIPKGSMPILVARIARD